MARRINNVVAKPANHGGAFQVPFRGIGYKSACQALFALGINKLHSFDVIVPAIKKAMGTDYAAFAAWDSGKETAFDPSKRMLTNVMVIARDEPQYGGKLKALGYEVRWDGRQKLAGIFKIAKASSVQPKAKKVTEAKPAVKKSKAK